MRTQALLLLLASTPLLAQTTRTAVHRTTPVHHAAHLVATTPCARLPELSPQIPALPPGTPCPRPLFTVTRTTELHADYISPLVSPELRQILDPAPTVISLVYADEKIGSGPLIQHGLTTEVLYTGYLPNGTKFDSSTDPAKPFSFELGGHHVIPGWDMGLEGMHIGGKRRLYVPYQLAYGDNGRGPIPPRSMLVFDIQVLKQTATPPPPPPSARSLPQPIPPHPSAPPRPPTAATPPATSTPPATPTKPAQPSTEPAK